MQVRAIKKLLNNTDYTVNNRDGVLCISSPMVDVIKLDSKTLELSYWSSDGKPNPKQTELTFIWNTLSQLKDTAEFKILLESDDVIENPIPVFSYDDNGNILESETDELYWPNTTKEGFLMCDNVWFDERSKAIEKAISETKIGIKWAKESIEELEAKLNEQRLILKEEESVLEKLLSL